MNIQPIYKNNVLTSFKRRIQPKNNLPQNITPISSIIMPIDTFAHSGNIPDTYDSFTGLRDKQALLSTIERIMSRCRRENKELSIAMFDMDNFKSVNEFLGYETGDYFIKHISNCMRTIARKNYLNLYRFGGEEFVLIFNGQSKEKQKAIVDDILTTVNSNPYVKSQEKEYRRTAKARLEEYTAQTEKIEKLESLETRKQIYKDLRRNLSTEEGKNDPYLLQSIVNTNNELNNAYLDLLAERIDAEEDTDTQELLTGIANNIKNGVPFDESVQKLLDEYLKFHYDKSAEMYQTKKWLNDFDTNNGFSISGVIVNFKPKFLKDKIAINVINTAGEELKKEKHYNKINFAI